MARANCNWWQYSKWVYNVGRTARLYPYAPAEKTAVVDFITAEWETSRTWLVPRLSLKVAESQKATDQGYDLAALGDESLGRMVQVIGLSLKVTPPTEEEKELCDALFEATGSRRDRLFEAEDEESVSESSSAAEASESGSVTEPSDSASEGEASESVSEAPAEESDSVSKSEASDSTSESVSEAEPEEESESGSESVSEPPTSGSGQGAGEE